jgi:glycosyltransferase involved in cell wall biosynthesis
MRTDADLLFVVGTLEVGGSETKIVKIANALARDGYSVGIAYLNPPETLLREIHSGVHVVHLQRRGKFSISSVRRLRNVVIASGARVVAAVNLYPLLYVLPAVKLRESWYGKAIALINTTEFVDGQWIWGYLYAPFLRRCDQLIYGCMAQQQAWTKKYKLPANRSSHIYNGVDAEVFSPDAIGDQGAAFRVEHGLPGDATVIGSVGRFAPEKNFELLIRTIGELRRGGRDAYLVLVGAGKEKSALMAASEKAGISDRIRFPGVLRDIRPAVSAMDVFVLPSRAVETFSNAALEAMSLARPVVLSNIGGAAEMIEHGKSGYLFDNEDGAVLAEILISLYDSGAARERIGRAARLRVKKLFHFEAMLNRYKALLDLAPPGIERIHADRV